MNPRRAGSSPASTARHGERRAGSAPSGSRDLIRLAWPSVLSFVCNSAYRVNDQFWVQDLGAEAHAALGPCTFLLILNFALFFVAVSGSLSLLARSTGAAAPEERDRTIRHSLVLATIIGAAVSAIGFALTPAATSWLGMQGRTAEFARSYLSSIYLYTLPLALAPLVETIFIAMGNTRIPLLLQLIAVSCNFVLNPVLIYGWGPIAGLGMEGAAIATCASRGVSVLLGLWLLKRVLGVRYFSHLGIEVRRLLQIVRIGLPSALSVAVYAGVYFVMIRTVLSPLGNPVLAGLSIGFNAFEGLTFPFFLGLAVAGSGLVGRNLGASSPQLAMQAVRSMSILGGVMGLVFSLGFLLLGPQVVPMFTSDPDVTREAVLYVRVLAASQLFVAFETVYEKVLMGAGHTVPIFLISVPGNLLRLPLAWLFAGQLGMGAAGVWWAINFTTLLKAIAFACIVRKGAWLEREVRST